jgi:hypothetical protein
MIERSCTDAAIPERRRQEVMEAALCGFIGRAGEAKKHARMNMYENQNP